MARNAKSYGVKLVRGPFVELNPHRQACSSPDQLVELIRNESRPLAADLFCGAGGLSLGLEEAGFAVVVGVDHDADSLATHRAQFPGLTLDWDLSSQAVVDDLVGLFKQLGIDLIAGGPPCQPFSKAGRSRIRSLVESGSWARDDRRDLWQSFLEIVLRVHPPAVLMENVPDMALDRDMLILRTMVDALEGEGYSVHERVLPAWKYGVPQFRHRLFLVALAGGLDFHWPVESDTEVSVWDAIGDLPPVEGGWRPQGGAEGWAAYDAPRTSFQRTARSGLGKSHERRIYDHITRPVRADDARAFAQMTSKTRYTELDSSLKRYRDDIFVDKYKRLEQHSVSRTITAHIAKDGYWYIHPTQDRTITVREAARLQTFPDRVRFAGPPSSAFRQIGNAVPPALARALGDQLLASLAGARTQTRNTQATAMALADWFDSRRERGLTIPWLEANTRWQVIQAELLLNRLPQRTLRSAWPAVRRWQTPGDTLDGAEALRSLARLLNRSARGDQLLEAAHWYEANPGSLSSIEAMAGAPHVSENNAQFAARVVSSDDEDPVIITGGLLRVASRFHGLPVDRLNKMTDGRLALARLVGVDPASDAAFPALIELAAAVCRPTAPLCDVCPLVKSCAVGASNGDPATLLNATPAG